jgi:hypothetical protein
VKVILDFDIIGKTSFAPDEYLSHVLLGNEKEVWTDKEII